MTADMQPRAARLPAYRDRRGVGALVALLAIVLVSGLAGWIAGG